MMTRGFMLIPADPRKKIIHIKGSMTDYSESIGKHPDYLAIRYRNNRPVKLEGELYYVDIEL